MAGPILTGQLISADTETALIQPGLKAPPLACVSYCTGGGAPALFHWTEARSAVEFWLAERAQIYHYAAFDMAVYCAAWPDLIPLVFDAYRDGRVLCSQIAQKIYDIATGEDRIYMAKKGAYALDAVMKRHKVSVEGVVTTLAAQYPVDKSNPWRKRFGELRGLPVDRWPEEAVQYALWDAPPPACILDSIQRKGESFPGLLDDYPAQCALSFCLHLISCYGVRTDLQRVQAFATEVQGRLDKAQDILIEYGLIRHSGNGFTRNLRAARERVRRVCSERGLEFELTETGVERAAVNPSGDLTDYAALDKGSLAGYGDEVLDAYSDFSQATTLRSKVEDLRAGAYYPLQPEYTNPLATGRTSCRKPGKRTYGAQLQNPPARIPGFREAITARPGHGFISIDFGRMELVCLAQVLCWMTGAENALMHMLNSDIDPLSYFGGVLGGLTYDQMMADPSGTKPWRNMSKPCWYGFPGGMGPQTFTKWAYAQYGQRFEVEQVKREIKPAWLSIVPEMRQYFAYMGQEAERGYSRIMMPWGLGRYRGNQTYTAACNEKYQGLGAAAVNAAFIACMQRCYADPSSALYGSRVWNVVHDELLFETPLPRIDPVAREATAVMLSEFRRFTPQVKITAEPVAMLCWSKDAKPTFDAQGRLVPWVGETT